MKKEDFHIVALGASAGGAEAIIEFFSNLPEDPDMAFIIIRHLKRDHKTEFESILRKYTTLNIVTVTDPVKVEANTIFIMPETHKLSIKDRTLFTIERPEKEIINNAINDFFVSLAEDVEDKAIGNVLSGFMADGDNGAKKIEEKGGMVMVQDPKSALVDGMPLQTILIDHPDFVLPPMHMPKALFNYVHRKKQYF